MTLVGIHGVKAKGVGAGAGEPKITEAFATVLGMDPGGSTHKCDPPVVTCNTVVTITPKQGSWKEPRPLVPTLRVAYATRLLTQQESAPWKETATHDRLEGGARVTAVCAGEGHALKAHMMATMRGGADAPWRCVEKTAYNTKAWQPLPIQPPPKQWVRTRKVEAVMDTVGAPVYGGALTLQTKKPWNDTQPLQQKATVCAHLGDGAGSTVTSAKFDHASKVFMTAMICHRSAIAGVQKPCAESSATTATNAPQE